MYLFEKQTQEYFIGKCHSILSVKYNLFLIFFL